MSSFFPRNRAERQRAAVLQERRRAIQERKFAARFRKELLRAGREAASLYEKTRLAASVEQIAEAHSANLASLLQDLYRTSIDGVVRAMVREMPKSLIPRWETKDLSGEVDRLIVEWINSRALRKARLISKTTRDQLLAIIKDMTEREATNPKAIARRMVKDVRSLSPHRARMIARTETHTAAQNASLTVASSIQTTGMRKEWVSVMDERTRESHSEVDGQKVALNEGFNVRGSSLKYPGDPVGPAGEVINCRCVMVYTEDDNG